MTMNYNHPRAISYLNYFPYGKGKIGMIKMDTSGLSYDPSIKEVGIFLDAKPGDMWETNRVSEFGHFNQYRRLLYPKDQEKEYSWIWPSQFNRNLVEEAPTKHKITGEVKRLEEWDNEDKNNLATVV